MSVELSNDEYEVIIDGISIKRLNEEDYKLDPEDGYDEDYSSELLKNTLKEGQVLLVIKGEDCNTGEDIHIILLFTSPNTCILTAEDLARMVGQVASSGRPLGILELDTWHIYAKCYRPSGLCSKLYFLLELQYVSSSVRETPEPKDSLYMNFIEDSVLVEQGKKLATLVPRVIGAVWLADKNLMIRIGWNRNGGTISDQLLDSTGILKPEHRVLLNRIRAGTYGPLTYQGRKS